MKLRAMKLPCRLLLSAAVLTSLPPAHGAPRGGSAVLPAPQAAAGAAADGDSGAIDGARSGQGALKQFAAAAKELPGLEDAVERAATAEQKAAASRAAVAHRKSMDQLQAQLAQAEPNGNPKILALTKKLDAIAIRGAAFKDAPLREVIDFLNRSGKASDPAKAGVPIRATEIDGKGEPLITFHLETASLRLLLQVVAEQAGLVLDIGEDEVSLRARRGPKTPNSPGEPPAERVIEDVAFFERKYNRLIVGVKPIGAYPDPDQFYAAIAAELGIVDIALAAAAAQFGWNAADGKVTRAMVKGGPTAGGGPGSWDVSISRIAINPATKQPDRASMEIKMVQIDYDGVITFPRAK